MRGVVTSLGFTIWGRNNTSRMFNQVQRDVIATRAALEGLDGRFVMWTRRMRFAGREARLFSLVIMTYLVAPLLAATGAAGGAAIAIAAVGAALVGIGAVGVYAVEQMSDEFKRAHGITEGLTDQFKRLKNEFLADIAPSFVGTFKQVQSSLEVIAPAISGMFKKLAPYLPAIVKATEDLALTLIPAITSMMEAAAPHIPAFIAAFKPLGALFVSIGDMMNKLGPGASVIVSDLIRLADIIVKHFLSNLGPLLDGFHAFFRNAEPGLITFFEGLAQILNDIPLDVLGTFLTNILESLTPGLINLMEAVTENLPWILNMFEGFVDLLAGILENDQAADTIVKIAAAIWVLNGALKVLTALSGALQLLTLGGILTGGKGKGKGGKLGKGLVAGSLVKAGLPVLAAESMLQLLTGEGMGWLFGNIADSYTKGYENGGGFIGGVTRAIEDGVKGWKPTKQMEDSPLGQIMFGMGSGQDEKGTFKPGAGRRFPGGAQGSDGKTLTGYQQPFSQFGKWLEDLRKNLWTAGENVHQFGVNLGRNLRTAGENVYTFGENLGKNLRGAGENVYTFGENLGKNLRGAAENVVTFGENIGTNLRTAFENARVWVVTTWNSMWTQVRTAWNNFYDAVLGPIVNFFTVTLPGAFQSARTNVVRAWNNMWTWLTNLWNNFYNAVLGPIVNFFRVTIPAAAEHLRNKVVEWWNSMWTRLKTLWNTFYNNVIGPIINFFRVTIPAAAEHLRNKVVEWWESMAARVEGVKRRIHDNVIAPISRFFRETIPNAANVLRKNVIAAFERTRSGVASVWAKLKDAVAAPVNFVIDRVYNKGIVRLWNNIAGAIGLSKAKLDPIGLIATSSSAKSLARKGLGAAAGGAIYGAGNNTSDSIPARLSHGEHVWTAEEVRAAGGHRNVAQLRSAMLGGSAVQSAAKGINIPGFKDGGGVFGSIKELGKKAWDALGDITRGFVGEVADPMLGGLKKLIDNNIPATPPVSGLVRGAAKKPIDWILDWIKDDDEKHGFSGSFSGGYKGMFKWIASRVKGTRLNSGLRVGDPGYHGRGQAVDLGFSDRSEFGPGMRGKAGKAFNLIKGAFKPGIAELIWDFAKGKAVWNGKDHFFTGSGAGPGTHADHIHWAMRNKGYKGIGGGLGAGTGGSVGRWRDLVVSVMREIGVYSPRNLANVMAAIKQESGGNPRAINKWDSNARAGIPSMGLLQTILPTFNAYAGKYRSRGPYDPRANLYAAIRYARSRYGSGWAARMNAPAGVGYAKGGAVSYDSGGMLQPGYTLAYNGTGKPEPVGHDLGGDIIINIHGDVYDGKKFDDRVIAAVHEGQRKRRIST